VSTSNQQPSESSSYVVPDDFECIVDLPDNKCAAKKGKFISSDTHLTCEFCGGQVVAIINEPEESMQVGEEESDDDDGDYVDEVTVSESEMLAGRTPEESAAALAFTAIDNIKNICRTSPDTDIQQFGEWVDSNKFQIRDIYMILFAKDFFSLGQSKERRVMGIIVAYATYIDKFEILGKVYDFLNFNETMSRKDADRVYEEYTGDTESRVLMWIRIYGDQLKVEKEIIRTAIEMWETAEPVYVATDEQIRAVVWLMLTRSKITGKKFNRAALSRATGFDSRTIAKVQNKFEPYFE